MTALECTKIKYWSREVAGNAATLLSMKYGNRKMRPYRCPYCADGSWHLKTQKPQPPKWIRERDKRRRAEA